MKIIIGLLLICSGAVAQPASSSWEKMQAFRLTTTAEEQERRFNELINEGSIAKSDTQTYNEYRVALAINWLAKGNLERYRYYTKGNPGMSFINLMDFCYALEYLETETKNSALIQQVSAEVLQKIDTAATLKEEGDDRTQVLLELNAMANARLGNVDIAMRNFERSSTIKGARESKYFKDSKANYLNRYAIVLAAAGEHKKAFDMLTEAVRNADSNSKLVATFKELFKKVNGNDKGYEKLLGSLQDEAYRKYYDELEKLYIVDTQLPFKGVIRSPEDPNKNLTILTASRPVASISIPDLNGKMVKLSDYKGKILTIDFWTTGCTPCVAAFAGFEKVVAEYNKDQFQLFVINLFEPQSHVRSFITKRKIPLDVLHDEPNEAYDIQATPTKIVFDMRGNIRFYAAGYAGSTDREYYKLKAMVEIIKSRATESSAKISK